MKKVEYFHALWEQSKKWKSNNFKCWKRQNLYLHRFIKGMTKVIFSEIFTQFGEIELCKTMRNENDNSKGFDIVW